MQNQSFRLKPSRYYLTMLGIVVLLSLYLIITLTCAFYIKLLLSVLVLLYAIRIARHDGLLVTQNAIHTIEYKGDGLWLIQTKNTKEQATLKGDSTVTQVVSVLRFIISGHHFPKTCLIFCDALPAEEYRLLCLILKML